MGSIRIRQLTLIFVTVMFLVLELKNGNGRDGDMFKDMGRNNSIPHRDRTQPLMSAFDEDQVWSFGAFKNVDPGPTAHLQINVCHPKAPPAPDPVKLDPNLSPLGGETTSTPVSKFSSDLYYDAVDRDPSDKRSSDTVDRNECRHVVQGQVVLAASDRRNTLIDRLVYMTILLEAPNYSHDHDVIFT
jgi:hypothetical protein